MKQGIFSISTGCRISCINGIAPKQLDTVVNDSRCVTCNAAVWRNPSILPTRILWIPESKYQIIMKPKLTHLKTNTSLENGWLEDVFSFIQWSLLRGHSFIFGGIPLPNVSGWTTWWITIQTSNHPTQPKSSEKMCELIYTPKIAQKNQETW